jgi:hypothetical protein
VRVFGFFTYFLVISNCIGQAVGREFSLPYPHLNPQGMDVETLLETNAQFAETSKPGMRALDPQRCRPNRSLRSTARRAIRAVIPRGFR